MNQNQKELYLANASRVIDKKHILVLIKDNQGRAVDMHEYDVFNDNAYQELKATVEQNKAIVSVEKQLAKEKADKELADKELALRNAINQQFKHQELLLVMNTYYVDLMRGMIDENTMLEDWFHAYLLDNTIALPDNELFNQYWAMIHKGETL